MSDDDDSGEAPDADEYDFYPCWMDDAPASISLNLRFEHEAPLDNADTLYWVSIEMRDLGEYGIGSEAESGRLWPAEDAIIDRVTELGLVYVGRLRTSGDWQMTFYGPPDALDALQAIANEVVIDHHVQVGTKPDADWSYYFEYLLPDAERRQWMQDRRLVTVLMDQGDTLATPRRVDHWAYFATASDRDAFAKAATAAGFVLEAALEDNPGERPFGAHVYRDDCVELDHIHEVVMLLYDAALANNGVYDGWETSIEAPRN